MYTPSPLVADLMRFLDSSPVNFAAVEQCRSRLDASGFSELDPAATWSLQPSGRYYITKNGSALIAFILPASGLPASPCHIISAHSDSPGFRIKPHAAMVGEGGIVRLNTEVYGGPILYTWFDRPLSIAGRVVLKGSDALQPVTRLVNFRRPLLTIPHLAIHFNRAVNEGNPLSRQKDMLPVLGYLNDTLEADSLLSNIVAAELSVAPDEILDFDLSLYDTTPACLLGLNNEFITSGRIDDLSMVHAAVTSLTAEAGIPAETVRIAAIFDNEETGSGTKQGAASPWLMNLLRRINYSLGGDEQTYQQSVARSFMISADNAHGLHPNYPEKQDPTNHPLLGHGPVIKYNANCKYMTDAESAAIFMQICREAGVEYQTFVNHSDVAGGSTLGNILTTQIDLRGVDMGAAIWAMHSVRETASAPDHDAIARAFRRFYHP